jgi:glycosyltransferase involved in cell wall biosynthesis
VFLSWKRYQRRSDTLAEALGAEILWRPHKARSTMLRPLDYADHFARDVGALRRRRPPYAIVQTPPHPPGFAPYLLRVPYVVDAHNGQFQSWWGDAPLSKRILRGARLVLTHSAEVDAIARAKYPDLPTLLVHDPLRDIPPARTPSNRIFIVATVAADEPMEVLIDTIESMPDVEFTTSAPLGRLPAALHTRARGLRNLTATGFLDLPAYEEALASALAVLVLTTREATQPSGACEALSAGRPLIVSRTRTTETLFGSFATLVENDRDSLGEGIREALKEDRGDLVHAARAAWKLRTAAELAPLKAMMPARAAP